MEESGCQSWING